MKTSRHYKNRTQSASLIFISLALLTTSSSIAQEAYRIEKNVVIGMVSGLALVMDVHYPETPSGYGIVHVSGSGFRRPLAYDAPPILFIHGDSDALVSIEHPKRMVEKMKAIGLTSRLLTIPSSDHGPTFPGAVNPPDYIGQTVQWFDTHLKQ